MQTEKPLLFDIYFKRTLAGTSKCHDSGPTS